MKGRAVRAYIRVTSLLLLLPILASFGVADEEEDRARRVRAAAALAANIWAQLGAQDHLESVETIAVAPLFDDRDGALRRALLTGSDTGGFAVVSSLTEQQRRALEAVPWRAGERDVVEPASVIRVAELTGADAVLYGRVVLDVTDYDPNNSVGDAYTVAKMKLADGATGGILWVDWNDAAGSRNPPPVDRLKLRREEGARLAAEAEGRLRSAGLAVAVFVVIVVGAVFWLRTFHGA